VSSVYFETLDTYPHIEYLLSCELSEHRCALVLRYCRRKRRKIQNRIRTFRFFTWKTKLRRIIEYPKMDKEQQKRMKIIMTNTGDIFSIQKEILNLIFKR